MLTFILFVNSICLYLFLQNMMWKLGCFLKRYELHLIWLWCITLQFVTRLSRRVPLVEQELLTLPEYLSAPPVLSGVRVTRSLVLCVCFVDRCLSLCIFSFGHCVVCSSSTYGFWLKFWYLQTIHTAISQLYRSVQFYWFYYCNCNCTCIYL
jgi:hypothetical protein